MTTLKPSLPDDNFYSYALLAELILIVLAIYIIREVWKISKDD